MPQPKEKQPFSQLWREAGWRGRAIALFAGSAAIAVVAGASLLVGRLVMVQVEARRELAAHEPVGESEQPTAPVPERDVEPFTYSFEVRGISIPLADRAATKIAYANFSLSLDCATPACKRAMELNRARLLDTLFETATRFYLEDLQGPEGLSPFKTAIVSDLRGAFGELSPREIAIRDWVIQ